MMVCYMKKQTVDQLELFTTTSEGSGRRHYKEGDFFFFKGVEHKILWVNSRALTTEIQSLGPEGLTFIFGIPFVERTVGIKIVY